MIMFGQIFMETVILVTLYMVKCTHGDVETLIEIEPQETARKISVDIPWETVICCDFQGSTDIRLKDY